MFPLKKGPCPPCVKQTLLRSWHFVGWVVVPSKWQCCGLGQGVLKCFCSQFASSSEALVCMPWFPRVLVQRVAGTLSGDDNWSPQSSTQQRSVGGRFQVHTWAFKMYLQTTCLAEQGVRFELHGSSGPCPHFVHQPLSSFSRYLLRVSSVLLGPGQMTVAF